MRRDRCAVSVPSKCSGHTGRFLEDSGEMNMKPRGFAQRMVTFMQETTQGKATAATIVVIVCLVALGPVGGKAISSAADARAPDATLRLVITERPVGQDAPAEVTVEPSAGFTVVEMERAEPETRWQRVSWTQPYEGPTERPAVVPNAPARLAVDSSARVIEGWNEPRTEIALRCSTEGWVGRNVPAEASRISSTPSAQMTIRSSSRPEPAAETSDVRRLAAPDRGWTPRGMGPERRELLAVCLSVPVASSQASPEPRRREEQHEAQADRHRTQLATLALSAPAARPAKQDVDRWTVCEEVLAGSFPDSDVQLVAAADELFVQGYARDAGRAAEILAVVRDRAAGDEEAGRSAGSVRVVSMLQIPEVRSIEGPIEGPIAIVGPFGHGK